MHSEPKKILELFLFIFGVYLSVCGGLAVLSREWPIIMPPQLDIIGIPFSTVFGSFGVIVLGSAILVLGLFLSYFTLKYLIKRK